MHRLLSRGRDFSGPVAAIVETLEARVLLSSIVVNSTGGGQDYASTVTAGQLDPTHTAVTLRDAINAANNTGGAFTISFDASIFPPNAATPTTIVLSGGAPLELKDTSGATTISGPGAGQVVINANRLSTVFEVDPGVSAAITGLTITGGQASVDFGGAQAGGGVYNAGTLILQNDIITANNAGTYGGGLFNSGTVTIAGTTLDHDSAQFGGGFFNSGTATVLGSTLSMNTATMNGGGFYSLGTATVAGSTLSTNTAGNWGGGFFNNNTVTVSGSTLAHNSAGVYGGGFFNSLNATVTESTLTDNSAQYGGGIMNFSSTTVTASTIARNFAQFAGGGIYHAGSNAAFFDTIVAQNAVSPTDATPSDWFGGNANSASADNLFGDGTNTGLVSGGANHNFVGTPSSLIDPHLAALADNGGLTQTMALLAGSPAINAGSNALVAGLTTDQRGIGFDRIAGGTVDIGAFEIQSHPPAPPTVGSSITDTSIPTLSGTWDSKNAVVLQVTINGTTYTLGSGSQLTSDGAGHWTLTTSTPITDGTYAVSVHTVNDIGEVTDVTTPGALLDDTVPPAPPTVNSLATNNNTPTLTGTWDQGTPGGAVVLLVTVGGTTYTLGSDPQVTSDGQGHWSLAISTPIPDGTYNVLVHTADAAGNNSDVTATNVLLVDTTPPAPPTVNALITNHNTPILTGTWDQGTPGGAVVLQVTFNGTTFTLGTDSQLTSDGSGHWRLAMSSSVVDGTYDVAVHTADAVGNVADTTAAGAVIVDTTPPAAPTDNSLITTHSIPILTGTWDQGTAGGATVLQVTVNGTTFTLGSNSQLTSDGSGHWSLTKSAAIPDGTYAVLVHTADAAGNVSDDSATGALIVDTVPPAAPTVNSLITNHSTPILTGTWDQGTPGGATVLQVTVSGTTFTLGTDSQLTSDGSGHWTLTTSTVVPDGTYAVLVHTADAAGKVSDDSATGALIVDTVPPAAPTVNSLITNHSTPILTGTWDQGTPGGATVLQVTVNGTTFTLGTNPQLTSDGSGHWTLTTSAALADGSYDVAVHTADAAGNVSDDSATGALIVDTVPPASPTVNSLITNHSTPILTGTWDQGTAGGATVLQVTVNGTTFTLGSNSQLTSDGSGHWSLTESAAIPDGTYAVLVHTADAAGNVSDDSATGRADCRHRAPRRRRRSIRSSRITVRRF